MKKKVEKATPFLPLLTGIASALAVSLTNKYLGAEAAALVAATAAGAAHAAQSPIAKKR